MYLTDCRDEFLYDCECRHLAKGTLRNYRAQINILMEYLAVQGITDVEQVRPTHIRAFMKSKEDTGCKPSYVNDLLKVCKTWFGYLANEGYIKQDISKKVKNVRQPKVIINTFSQSEIRRLLNYYSGADYLSVRNKTILALLLDTGARCNEMIMMQPQDIGDDYIVIKHGKGGKERVVPKSPYLGKLLMKYSRVRAGYFGNKATKSNSLFLSNRGKCLTGEAVARIIKEAAKNVGVSSSVRVSPHTCRHTFAQMQLKNGLDLYSLSRLMGHTNITITQRYLQGLRDKDIIAQGNRTSPLMHL